MGLTTLDDIVIPEIELDVSLTHVGEETVSFSGGIQKTLTLYRDDKGKFWFAKDIREEGDEINEFIGYNLLRLFDLDGIINPEVRVATIDGTRKILTEYVEGLHHPVRFEMNPSDSQRQSVVAHLANDDLDRGFFNYSIRDGTLVVHDHSGASGEYRLHFEHGCLAFHQSRLLRGHDTLYTFRRGITKGKLIANNGYIEEMVRKAGLQGDKAETKTERIKTNLMRMDVLLRHFISKEWSKEIEFYCKKPTSDYFGKKNQRVIQGQISLEHLKNLVNGGEHKGVIIYPPTIGWNTLYQRPHQMMKEFAKQGYLALFVDPNWQKIKVNGIHKLDKNLYLCDPSIDLTFIDDPALLITWPKHQELTGLYTNPIVIYEVIDELDVFMGGNALKGADNILTALSDIVTTSADALYKRKVAERGDDVLLLPNAAVSADFNKTFTLEELPDDIRKLKKEGKPIIGYYGALANWLDYELIERIVEEKSDCNVVLIGPAYHSGAYRKLKELSDRASNLHLLGTKDYNDLAKYLSAFDVATIPFDKTSDIIKSTSPVKMFEYMAGQKPIVTTDFPEARKYDVVLRGGTHEEFIRQVEKALTLKGDKGYKKRLLATAEQNSWESRCRVIADKLDAIAEDPNYVRYKDRTLSSFDPDRSVVPGIKPVVSVYMPLSKENIRFVREAIDSVLMQSVYENTEICICFDNSEEKGRELYEMLAKEYHANDPASKNFGRIRWKTHGENKGAAAASNTAIEMCLGKYIMQLDPDDKLIDRYAIEKMVRVMEKNENIGLLYADYILIDEAGEKIGKRPNEGAFSSSLLKKGYNQIGLRLWRRDLLDAVKSMGGVVDTLFSQDGEIFDSSLRVGSDLGVLLKAERYCRQNGLRIRHYEGERVNGLFGSIVMNAPIVGAFCGSPYLAAYRQHPGADSHRFPHQQMETFAELAQRSNAVN